MILNRLWNATTGCIKTFWVRNIASRWARSVWMWQKISLWFSVASLPSGTSPTRLGLDVTRATWYHVKLMWSCLAIPTHFEKSSKRSETIWNVFDLSRSEKCVASTCAEWSDCCRPSGLLWHGLEAGSPGGGPEGYTLQTFLLDSRQVAKVCQGQVTDPGNRP